MKKLNNRFDTSKPFIEAMVEETNEQELPDSVFSQACEEFGLSEEEAMELMVNSDNYNFYRSSYGWNIITK
jgi:Asp-tRNA(Asn)/Glu-tRNA(Gln) amidotransferase B subunit